MPDRGPPVADWWLRIKSVRAKQRAWKEGGSLPPVIPLRGRIKGGKRDINSVQDSERGLAKFPRTPKRRLY